MILFFISIFGFLFNFRNIIIIMISLELSLLSINLFLIASSIFLNDIVGLIFSLIILTVAASEAAIGLAIFFLFFQVQENISIKNKNYLRG